MTVRLKIKPLRNVLFRYGAPPSGWRPGSQHALSPQPAFVFSKNGRAECIQYLAEM
jgi:hypothetical protein